MLYIIGCIRKRIRIKYDPSMPKVLDMLKLWFEERVVVIAIRFLSTLVARLLCHERVHSVCCSNLLEGFLGPDLLQKLNNLVFGGSVPPLVLLSMSYTFLQPSIVKVMTMEGFEITRVLVVAPEIPFRKYLGLRKKLLDVGILLDPIGISSVCRS